MSWEQWGILLIDLVNQKIWLRTRHCRTSSPDQPRVATGQTRTRQGTKAGHEHMDGGQPVAPRPSSAASRRSRRWLVWAGGRPTRTKGTHQWCSWSGRGTPASPAKGLCWFHRRRRSRHTFPRLMWATSIARALACLVLLSFAPRLALQIGDLSLALVGALMLGPGFSGACGSGRWTPSRARRQTRACRAGRTARGTATPPLNPPSRGPLGAGT